jgi:di/tricarboxylate transporter
MKPKTPRALAEFAVILVIVGLIITDPLAGFSILVLAGIITALALAFGSKIMRLAALILLVIILALAIWKFPDARLHLQRYREHAPKQPAITPHGHKEQPRERRPSPDTWEI